MSAMGDKAHAKRLLKEKAPNVPTIPGYNGDNQDEENLKKEAEKIGVV
jgi:3-methylcrotonyl-CoA carboxylase alpha subunit